MAKVCIQSDKETMSYPDGRDYFSPSEAYPEYRWTSRISSSENRVYRLVRECLRTLGLDSKNYGTEKWNPLGEYIKRGDTILLKPNWVENKNKNREVDDNLACLVTNPSVVRAVIDYVVIALDGMGRIIIADAPMQGCDLDDMFKITGYTRLFEFYKQEGIRLEVYDLRKYSVEKKYKGVFLPPKLTNNGLGSVKVDLSESSMHSERDADNPKYKVEDYEQKMTAYYHSGGCHTYEINELPLQADVIINLPKPKTHRLAGITGACKNFVGITFEKASLPHRIDGDKAKEHGDAYERHSMWKDAMRFFNEKRTYYSRTGAVNRCKLYDILMKSSYLIGAVLSGDKYRVGSWYGNDTIWRTVVDLNNIMLHANKQGIMCKSQQRRIISIGDMIIGGEKEGPVGPTPKPLGIILFADNNLVFDRVVCEIMGFDDQTFKCFHDSRALSVYGWEEKNLNRCIVRSNIDDIDQKEIQQMSVPNEWHFEPHSCWKGHIERNER